MPATYLTSISEQGTTIWKPWSLIVLLMIQLSIGFFIIIEQWLVVSALVLFPFIFFMIFNLRTAINMLLLSLFIGFFLIEQPVGIRAIDIMVVIMIIAYILNRAIRRDFSLLRTPLDKPIILFIGAIAISLIGSYNYQKAIINLLRHIELFAIFYILVEVIRQQPKDAIKKLLEYYICAAVIASCIAILSLYLEGGSRAFGISGTSLSDLVVTALIISTVLLLFSTTYPQILKYSIISLILLLELILTQTRGAWLSFTLSFFFIGFLLKKKSIFGTYKKYIWTLLLVSFALFIAYLFFGDVFLGITHRVEQVKYLNVGTIHFRLVLWDAAIKAFLSDPLNGIGIGQFALVSDKYSIVGHSAFFKENIGGLSAHNVILSYLAETGLIGVLSLFFLMFTFMRLGLKIYKTAVIKSEMEVALSLITVLFFVAISSSYAGSWFWSINGIQFMFFLALTTIVSMNNEIS